MARCSAAVGLPLVWVILVTAVVTRGGPSTGILERMDQCDTRCSQGLQCKTKRHFLSPPPCQSASPEALNSSAVFHSVRLSTIMLCEDRHACSLHLRVNVLLHLTEPVHGVSICVESAGTLGHCQALGFSRASRQRQAGQQVELEADCFEVRPGQQVWVTLKTVPNYCTVSWTSTYTVPDCNSGDLRSHVPECITGRLQYQLHPDGKQMSVSVSDMLEHEDYNVRLCHQDYVCSDTGAYALIRKEEAVKRVTLMYSRPVPCLCIEGWSAVMDAPRVQMCPFKDRLEELWYGITFDPVEETLSWEPACPVSASVRLCQSGGEESCEDLPHPHPTKTTGRKKITFTTVDPHPQLCMKFTVGSQNWTRCPFAEGRFQAWEAGVREREGHGGVTLLSQVTANFSVGVCTRLRGSPSVCQPDDVHTVHVEQREPLSVLLSEDFCKPNACVQVKRLDVKYAVTLLHCDLQCAEHNGSVESVPVGGEWDRRGSPPAQLSWVIVLAGLSLAVLTIVALGLYLMLTVYQRENPKEMGGKHTSEKHKEVHVEPTDCMIPEVQTHTAPPHTHMSMSDTFCHGNFEKTNLLSETSK